MINQQLLTYIRKQKEAGTDDATIKDNLESAGWRDEDIEEGFQAVENNIDGGDTSPQAHQDIREEAAGKRSNAEAEEGSGNEAMDQDSTVNTEGSDEYRESIKEEDKQGIAKDSTDSAGVEAGAENINTKKPEAQDAVSDTNDTEITKNASQKQSSDNDLDSQTAQQDNQLSKNPKQKKQDESVEPIDNNLGPTSLRTYEDDKRRAQNLTGKPKTKNNEGEKAQEEIVKLSEELNGSIDDKKQQSDSAVTEEDMNKAKKQKTPEEAAMEAREKRAEDHEKNLDSDLSGKGASGDMDAASVAAAKREQKKETKKKRSQEKLQQSPQKKRKPKARQTKDGRQRFSAKSNAGANKNKLSTQRKSRSTQKSSGLNLVSILLFILALVMVGGGAAYAYMTYFQSSEAETTATEVMESLAEAESFNFRITIESANGTTTESIKAIEGVADLSSGTSTQSYYTVTTSTGDSDGPIRAGVAEIENLGTVPDTQRETIRDILLSPEFFSVGEYQTQERLGQTEDNDGFVTNRFSVSLDSTQLVSDYATLHQALFNTALSEDVLSNLQASVSEFEATQGQAWIDTSTGVPYQITFLGTGSDGDDVQVNFQFKNHGIEPENTPAYNPRSIEQVLREYFTDNPIDSGPTVEESTTTPATSTDDEQETTSDEPTSKQQAYVRLDKLRINDIQQLSVALQVYASENGSYPQTLSSLTSAETLIVRSIPRDPEGGGPYAYSVSEDGDRFHLGATLRELSRSDVSGDANLNSRGLGLPGGFNGTSESCQNASGTTSTCYDVSGSLE